MADNEMERGSEIVAFVMDLMFGSRVRGAAPDAVLARSADALLEAVGPATRLVLVDLQADGALDALRALSEGSPAPEARVVAWGPHVMEETLSAARDAGADDVMPRGAFVKALGRLVQEARG